MAGPELLDRDRELHAVDGLVAEAAEGEARAVKAEVDREGMILANHPV
jgi:hypothetical protein